MKSSKFTSPANLATLANLELTPELDSALNSTLPDILSFVDQIKTLDLSNVKATSYNSSEENVLRQDSVTPSLSQEEALRNASRSADGFFIVPAVLDRGDGA